jgi:L-fuconolactonase
LKYRYSLIDSHVHFYDRTRPEGVLWPPTGGPYPSKALSGDLITFAQPIEIDGVILVETGWRQSDDEWLLKLAEHDNRIVGVIAHLQPGERGFEQRLRMNSKFSALRGIRLRPIQHYDLKSSRLKRHLKLLSDFNLTLELGAASHQKLVEFIDLANELSEVRCGLTHLGHPTIDGGVPDKVWRDSIAQLAELPNTFCKFTSLSEFTKARPAPENPEYYRQAVEFLLKVFGEDRIVFGSNWPRSSSTGGYAANIRLYQQILNHDEIALEKLLHRNATIIYGLSDSA